MIPNWLKDENEIYNRLKDFKCMFGDVSTGIDDLRYRYYRFLETGIMEGKYRHYRLDRYLNMPPGIETDNNNLKPISIVLSNWERYYYIPLIMEMYHNQDYPKNLIEIVIVDSNSTDKTVLLDTIKEQVKLYPDLKIRFIQDYISTYGPMKRQNIGIRYSSHDIIIINETDLLPLGKNFLRGICYVHNKFKNAFCLGIVISFAGCVGESEDTEFHYDDVSQTLNERCWVHYRLDHMYINSFNKELISSIHGFDEVPGWGGQEENTTNRYCAHGGKVILNTSIFSAIIRNFARKLPSGIIKYHSSSDCHFPNYYRGIIANDENWGTSDKIEEINL